MSSRPPLVFKFASEDWEFEQIHRLNYKTFVEEIPQHHASPAHRLVDKFDAENTYLICLCGTKLVGMLAVRGNRPFSLDQKLPELDGYLPAGRRVCEIRLLAVEKKFRGAQVLQGILALLWQHGIEKGYDLAIISGTTRQFKLYHHLGVVPFGPVVGSGEAQFQPMFITLETFETTAREFLRSSPARSFQASAVNFLPGPVAVRREVRRAFEQAPESHRADSFRKDFQAVRRALCELVNARNVHLFMGSGTLANDVIGGQLSLEGGRGLVLSSGEFGQRLADQARRWGLDFEVLAVPWGEPVTPKMLREKLAASQGHLELKAVLPARGGHLELKAGLPARGGLRWLWCTHCETSTGLVNDLAQLKAICSENNLRLCLDCISSIGTMPVDLNGVHFASCASGKGLRAYPGVSMVFHSHELAPGQERLPRYLDLSHNEASEGIPFTFSSNLLHALNTAVSRVKWDERFAELENVSGWLKGRLLELGFELVGCGELTSPAVATIALPASLDSGKIGEQMRESGYLLSYNSDYLRKRNWNQICTMGECAKDKLVSLVNTLSRACGKEVRSSHSMGQPASTKAL